MAPDVLHVAGYLTGAALYAMLLVLAVRDRAGDRLTLGTACLGLAWNVGELGVLLLRAADRGGAEPWLAALSFTSLGLLAAVVVHSVWRGAIDEQAPRAPLARPLAGLAYACAGAAGVLHVRGALVGEPVPVPGALVLLTAGLLALAPALLMATRTQTNGRRALWMTALAVFAVSALHLGNFHGPRESWVTELLGHHASIPLAFAILYQDYRFALADLFLKQALALLAAVAMIIAAWVAAGPLLVADPTSPRTIGVLFALWIASLLVFPWIRAVIARFVDRVILGRAHYAVVVDEIAALVQQCDSESAVLDRVCAALAPSLSATAVRWDTRPSGAGVRHGVRDIVVPTADAPQYVLSVERLAGGRRLLSDDLAMLERVAFLVSRRLDAIRLTDERYARMLREREMHSLAAEAELKALRAQINPHFLFNALTTIGYLIQTAPPRALATLLRLTTLLRSVLRSEGEFTTLGRERELIACYLEIEKERFEERLAVALDFPPPLDELAIPALIIQPLVENAVKHGIAAARDGGRIDISASLDERTATLHVRVSNTGAPFAGREPAADGGVGLRNVERRLAAHYGTRARVSVRATDAGATVAELLLPIAAAELGAAGGGERRRA